MNTQRKFSRRMGEQQPCNAADAQARHPCSEPLATRLALFLVRWGWVAVLAAVFLLTGCADELHTYAADQASLADAVAQAAKEMGQ